ncbi:hypothetical protein ACQJBY_058375 [Aegilops geniculata]
MREREKGRRGGRNRDERGEGGATVDGRGSPADAGHSHLSSPALDHHRGPLPPLRFSISSSLELAEWSTMRKMGKTEPPMLTGQFRRALSWEEAHQSSSTGGDEGRGRGQRRGGGRGYACGQ